MEENGFYSGQCLTSELLWPGKASGLVFPADEVGARARALQGSSEFSAGLVTSFWLHISIQPLYLGK